MRLTFNQRLLARYGTEAQKWFPKPKKGEYVWKATVYKHKFLPGAEDVAIHSERFWVEAQAKAFKKSVEAGLTRNTVRYEKVSIIEFDGYLG